MEDLVHNGLEPSDSTSLQFTEVAQSNQIAKILSLSDLNSEDHFRQMEASKVPHQGASVRTASLLMIADIVGVGVLSLANAQMQLGWIFGPLCILLFFPLNYYTAVLLHRVRMVHPLSVPKHSAYSYFVFNR